MAANFQHGQCTMCEKHGYLRALHDDKGGPLCCLMCIGQWHGEHGRRRRLGRIVIRALAAYFKGGGSFSDVDKLAISASQLNDRMYIGLDPLGLLTDTAHQVDETIELTSELLADAIKIAHPDLHPPERRDLAHRVTQGLVALQPFTFPAQKPEPVHKPESASSTSKSRARKPSESKPYPCKECADTFPSFYCTECKTEWDRRQQLEWEKETAKRREQYAKRKQRREQWRKPTICVACGKGFKGKRKDARFCSATCRQRGHRGVTDKKREQPGNQTAVTKASPSPEERGP